MADKKISELTQVSALNNGDLVEVSQVNALAPSGYTSLKASMTDLGKKVNSDIEYTTDLADFTDKTITGAIKETAKGKNVADEYDGTQTYDKGDVVIYKNTLYICTTNNTTGAWDATKWTATTIDNVIGDLSSLTTTVKSSLVGAVNEIASYTPVYGNTASGAIATFDTSLALPLQDCTIAINAVQESGTPSPSSPKAISGFTGANIHVADNETPHVIDNVTAISWQSEAGTVYGGLLDVTSGKLTVTHSIVDLGSLTQWNKNTSFTNTLFVANVSDKKTNNSNCICTNYTNGGIATGGTFLNNMANNNFASDTSNGIYIRDDSKASLSGDDFKTAMSGVYLVYELATPVTYQLTPTQISAIVGTNNVFTDTNGDTSVMYACSLKDYIDRQ